MYQGFTGRVATGNAKDSIAYGTNVVGGVTPGKEGEHIGLPLLPDLKKAKEQLKPDATAVFVAAQQCGKAIEDAIEAEIPLIVAVAEHIPVHDLMRVRIQIIHSICRKVTNKHCYRSLVSLRPNRSQDWWEQMHLASLHPLDSAESVSNLYQPLHQVTSESLQSLALYLTKLLHL